MEADRQPHPAPRYEIVTEEKAGGVTYTPKPLADFLARQIAGAIDTLPESRPLRILDPAIGHGELVVSLLDCLTNWTAVRAEIFGFETDPTVLANAAARLRRTHPGASLHVEPGNFLDFVLDRTGSGDHGLPETFDLIVANPPYVRTQVMGTEQSQRLARQFALTGRVDLYHAFLLGMSQVLAPTGTAGIIVSNRFMTTRSGASVRRALADRVAIRHIWDLGDTKLFEAAVLPAILLLQGKSGRSLAAPAFTSIYQTGEAATASVSDPLAALDGDGVVAIGDGRRFRVRQGSLDTKGAPDGVWRITSEPADRWLAAVEARSWGRFADIGKIRVGVKTCADEVFIRNDWQMMAAADRPELLRPLATHHAARRFRPLTPDRASQVLYPHTVVEGRRRAVDLAHYPRSEAYLAAHRARLERRRYVIEAGRQWYELWVPQDPDAWRRPKLVCRDIAAKPVFWIDLDGTVVNGDCYWLACPDPDCMDLLWLAAAVGNSTFIERYYDLRFNNRLYAGRRRFITQYVETFPLPDPDSVLGRKIIAGAKRVYESIPSPTAARREAALNALVWKAMTGGAPAPA